jgi:hypothetical protein
MFAGLSAASRYENSVSAEMLGAWCATLLIPLGLAFAAAKRKRTFYWRRFSLLLLVAVVVSIILAHRDSGTIQQKVADFFKEAASPTIASSDKSITPPELRMFKPIVRDYVISLRKLANDGRCDSIRPSIDSPESFASRENIAATIDNLQACSTKFAEINALANGFKTRVAKAIGNAKWSEDDKRQVLRAFNNGFQKGYRELNEYVVAGHNWIDKTSKVYAFTYSKRHRYQASRNQLLFVKSDDARRFNELADDAEAARKQFLDADDNLSRDANKFFSEYGITIRDLGFDSEDKTK